MYQIVRVYENITSSSENIELFSDALHACGMYAANPELLILELWYYQAGEQFPKLILEWNK